ncbi:MAG: hypothetical protein PHI98_09755 [Eubacteriales bacterium]|nr:hypothetical protein [Eubacteriales bacterium]
MRKLLSFFMSCCLLFGTMVTARSEQKLTAVFRGVSVPDVMSFEVPFDTSWFLADSEQYRHPLAQASLGMAVSAFRDNQLGLEHCGDHIQSFLEQGGFQNIQLQEYDQPTAKDTIGTAIATLPMKSGGSVLAVAVSGSGYGLEWLSNFDIGGANVHQGFNDSAKRVYERIQAYLSEYHPAQPIRVWLSGYSRAAAVANRTAVLLIEQNVFPESQTFAYTFATPNNVTKAEMNRSYNGIYNIVGQCDPVPTVPLEEWEYTKAGVTLRIPAQETDSDYLDLLKDAKAYYAHLTGGAAYENNPGVNWLVRQLCLVFLNSCHNVNTYSDGFQQVLSESFAAGGSLSQMLIAGIGKIISMPLVLSGIKNQANVLWTLASEVIYQQVQVMFGVSDSNSWNAPATLLSQVALEHYPQVYIAWVMSHDRPQELYTTSRSFRLVALNGLGKVEWKAADGAFGSLALGQADKSQAICAVMLGGVTLLTVPADQKYTLDFWPDSESASLQIEEYQAGMLSHRKLTYDSLTFSDKGSVHFILPKGLEELPTVEYNGVPYTIRNAEGAIDPTLDAMGSLALSDGLAANFLSLLLGVPAVVLLGSVLLLLRHHHNKKKEQAKG